MHRQFLPSGPGLPNNCGLADIDHLLDHVQFAQAIVPLLLARKPAELGSVFDSHILDVPQPVVDQPQMVVAQGRQTPPQP